MTDVIYIDGTDLRLGRMASRVAKYLLNGNKVVIVNVEKVVVSGRRNTVIEDYRRWLSLRTWKNPEKVGPKHHRSPDRLVYYAIRNMLPKKPSGIKALKRLKVYIGIPDELKSANFIQIEEAHVKYLRGPYVTLEEISRSLGWSG
ncbi:MAG: 50S ribosomal protein L13 [Candidatus Methanomethyliaceae archaeon]|nr:50S ribosomal protein L13 [Candidatus Methanomethyliaceae archaeon]MDW7970371.1 50S ribosomal protein L13 [Nitrososphaerota archaeon]